MNEFLSSLNLDGIMKIFDNGLVKAVIVLVVAFVMNRIVKGFIKRVIKKMPDDTRRAETVMKILSSITTAIIYFIAVLECARVLFGVNPATVIAATGVVGVGISFGAQGLVKDMISGFFILFENQYAVGELVTISGFTGNIVQLGLRSTQVRNAKGDLFTIPNGSISEVINHSRGERQVIIDVDIDYDADIDFAIEVLKKALDCENNAELAFITQTDVLGVSKLSESSVQLRVTANCASGDQFAAERALLKVIKLSLDENKISIPYNHIVVVNK